MYKKSYATISTFFLGLTLLAPVVEPKAALLQQKSVPAGFEDLLAPQETIVDIYYGGRFITAMPAVFTADSIEFYDPNLLIQKVPVPLLNAYRLNHFLSGELDNHSSAICLNSRDSQCGIIEPDIIGVIFDESRFRADLFINPDYLDVEPVDYNAFLPDSTAGPGLMQNITATTSGNLGNQNSRNNYTIFGDTFLSAGENSLQVDWDLSRDQNFSVNQLLMERDYQGKQWQAGLVYGSGFGLNFSNSSRLWGGRLSSSYNTRTDRSFTGGTPLEIFMPVRGRYEIVREERLLTSNFVDAGHQALNTSSFPSGAYDLTIRLFDEQGNLIKEETHFFAKQSRLPPSNDPEFFLEAGMVAKTGPELILPELTNVSLARAGVNVRLGDTWSGTFASASTPGQTLGEFSLFNIGRSYDLSLGTMIESWSDYGIRSDARYRIDALNLNASYMQLWREDGHRNESNTFDLLGNSFRQTSFSANYPLFKGNASYRYSLNDNLSSNDTSNRQVRQTISYSRPMYRDSLYSAFLRLDSSWTNQGDITGLMSIDLRHSKNNWSFRASPQTSMTKTSGGTSTIDNSVLAEASYSDRDTFAGNLNGSVYAEASSNRTSTGLSTRYASTWGSSNLNLNYADNNGRSSTAYSASISSSFTANQDVIAVGGQNQSRAAIVVTVNGAKEDERFDVYVDNQHKGFALGDRPSIVHLSPFATYQVSIRANGESLYSFDEKVHEVTLYPGNVSALDYEVKPVLLLYGRAQLSDGQWVSHASVEGGEGLAVSDEFGLFQAEVLSDTTELIFRKNGQECIVPLSPESYKKEFNNLGQVVCLSETPASTITL